MFKHNPLKVHLINDKIPDGTATTVYRCGPLIDLCRGPHITNTSRIKAFTVTKNSSSYFLGNAENQVLQRIYGISFPDKEQMKEYLKFKEEADQRDHRLVGRNQELFFFHELSPGSCFFLPHGARIYNRLLEFIRAEYRKRGFTEVITPNIFHENLWKISGHWEHYRDDMFSCGKGDEVFYLKPMNCPGHCLMFAHRERSYRELPIRFADFGVLHRNELTGALHGLTRVRRFQQDDAHIFCRVDQIGSEMQGCLDFLQHVYGILGFSFSLRLSTRPEKYLGELSVWDAAEKELAASLDRFGHPWEINPGDGAFYGPKIDITIMDAHKRKHQCATIQIDFQLPIRFNLEYRAPGKADSEVSSELARPVIIHRAVLGSIERCMAVLTESYGGDWPFWLSPRQAIVVPVSHANDEYALKVQKALHDAGFHVESDCGDSTFNKRIRNAETNKHTFILVVGNKEAEEGTVNLRKATADGKDLLLPLEVVLQKFKQLNESKPIKNFIEA
jgi:threonyl-tRNA synthetase